MNPRRVGAVVLRQLYLYAGSPQRVLPLFIWVTLDVVLWGFITRFLGQVSHSGFGFVPALLGAVLLWDFLTRVMQGITTAFFEDVWSRNFLNVFASPMRVTEYVAGLVSIGVANSLVLGTSWNLLAFQPANIVFSFGVGAALLIMGSYGRISGGLPLDSPYHREPAADAGRGTDPDRGWVPDPTAAGELAEAERAYALHYATPEQVRRLTSVHGHRSPRERAEAWRESGQPG